VNGFGQNVPTVLNKVEERRNDVVIVERVQLIGDFVGNLRGNLKDVVVQSLAVAESALKFIGIPDNKATDETWTIKIIVREEFNLQRFSN